MKIGIDLGTTNSALSYIDPREGEDLDFPPIHILPIPQQVAPGRVEALKTLPSFLFLDEAQPVGIYAREQGALVPTKLVHSAKSRGSSRIRSLDRTAKILPWDSPETGAACFRRAGFPRALFLRVPGCLGAEVETMFRARRSRYRPHGAGIVRRGRPASDRGAAEQAGLAKLTLLEEPAAAFYSWIANNFARSRKLLFDGQIVLVCDVGGGTSDFTLIRVGARRPGQLHAHRGRRSPAARRRQHRSHVPRLVEAKLGGPLSIRQRTASPPPAGGRPPRSACFGAEPEERRNHRAGRGLVADRRRSATSCAKRRWSWRSKAFPGHRDAARAQRRKRSLFREPGCPTFRPSHHQAPGRVSGGAGQTAPTPSFSTAASSSRRFCASACRCRRAHWYCKRPRDL